MARHLATWPTLFVFAACGSDAASATAKADAATAKDTATASACPAVMRRPDGTCCESGAVFDASLAACAPAGPSDCPNAVSDPTTCWPRWCAGDPPRACSAVEAETGCRPGTFPAPEAQGRCVPAGAWWPGEPLPAPAAVPPAQPPTLAFAPGPHVEPLAPHDQQRFCGTAGQPRLCAPDEKGCPVGHAPGLEPQDGCVPVGVPWLCPPGFVVTDPPKDWPSPLPPCAPDPEDCDTDPFGGVPDGPGNVFVAQGAKPPHLGTRQAPLVSIAEALKKAPTGGTIALAAGKYFGTFLADRPVTVVGRCAALVELNGTQQVALGVSSQKGKGAVVLKGLTIRGPKPGVVADNGAWLRVERAHLVDMQEFAALAQPGSQLELRDVVVQGIRPGIETQAFAVAANGGQVDLRRVRLCDLIGGGVQGWGAQVAATEVLVDGAYWDGDEEGASGLAVGDTSLLRVQSVRLAAIAGNGLRCAGKGTHLIARGVAVAGITAVGTTPTANGSLVALGCQAQLGALRVSDTAGAGVRVYKAGATLDGAVIERAGIADSPSGGRPGLEVDSASVLAARSLHVVQSPFSGVTLAHDATAVIDDARIEGLPGASGSQGYGVLLADRADLTLRRALLRDLSGGGIPLKADSRLVAEWVAVQRVWPRAELQGYGLGIGAFEGSEVDLRGVRIDGAHGLGMAILGGKVRAQGLLVAGVVAVELPKFRSHIAVLTDAGAAVALHGSWLQGSPVGVATNTGKARVVGTLLDGGQGVPDQRDYGAFAMMGGTLDLEAVRVAGTGGAGVLANQADLRITESAVLAVPLIPAPKPRNSVTDPVEFVDLGDGVVGYQASGWHVERSVIAQNGRAGVLLDACPGAVLRNSLVFGAKLGLAWQNGAGPSGEVQAVFDNSVQNRISDQGLQLPPLPGLAPAPKP